MKNATRLLIFTDLDGTLLDYYTYSWEAALPGLNQLFLAQIPLVLCTSKTRDETIYFRGQMGLEDPFIVENGAAIYAPLGYFRQPISDKLDSGYEVLQFGCPYPKVRDFLIHTRKQLALQIVGFGDLDARGIQKLTGLPLHQAELSRRRLFNEPFYFLDKASEKRLPELEKLARKEKLRIIKGGRFYHLGGVHDKGHAVTMLIKLFRRNEPGDWISVAIGDSPNDRSMLENVQIPCLVKDHRNEYHPEIRSRLSPRLAGEIGPKGWNRVVLQVLQEYNLVQSASLDGS